MKKSRKNLMYILLLVCPPVGMLIIWFTPEKKLTKKVKWKLLLMAAVWFFFISTMTLAAVRQDNKSVNGTIDNNIIADSSSQGVLDTKEIPGQNTEEKKGKDESSEIAESDIETDETVSKEYNKEGYDDLQQIFIQLTLDTTHKEFLNMIKNSKLYRCERTPENCGYDSYEYLLAKEKGVAKFGMADPGDYILVSFKTSVSEKLRYAVYCKENSKRYGLIYSYGVYGYFTETNAADYAGYYTVHQYYTDKDNTAESLIIEYTDMPSWDSGYYIKDSAKTLVDETVSGIPEWRKED